MTTFKELRRQYGRITVNSPNKNIYSKSINNFKINDVLDYWKTAEKFAWPNQPWYTGTGLHYCPHSNIKPLAQQVCGNHQNSAVYQDTLAFNFPINDLLNDFCSYKLVRCKITCLSSESVNGTLQRNEDWHRDESPFEALRVIIPLQTDPAYLIQLDNCEPLYMQVGNAYAFDQSQYHRVVCKGTSTQDRIHLILSVVTWFSYENEKWIPNHNFNKIHPLQVFESLAM